MVINLATIDFCPSGGGQKPEEVLSETITTNGSYSYIPSEGSVFSGVDITVDVPDVNYSYKTGVIPGLEDLGWDTDSINYLQANVPHYSWQDSEFAVSQANKDLYGVVNNDNRFDYMYNDDMLYLPKFDTSMVEDFGSYFSEFSRIKGIPILDYSGISENSGFDQMFFYCLKLETISPIPSVIRPKSCNYMFSNCESLKCVPLFNTSECTDFGGMFSYCTSLETVPAFDTSSATTTSSMFDGCTSLKEVPPMDLSSATNTGSMFIDCSSLERVGALNTCSSDNFDQMFTGCTSLKEILGIDFSGVTETISDAIWDGSAGNNITKFIVNGKLNHYYFSFTGLTNIDYQSVKSILQAADNTDNVEDQKDLIFNITMTDQNNELAGLVSSAESKGWTITGLTLV